MGRLISVGTPTDADFYASYTYHADGRLNSEKLANSSETRNHFYNSPGWLLRIDGDRFTEDITHTTGWSGAVGYYDGRIKTTSFTYNWAGKPADYAVQYTYDNLGQLTIADNNINNAWDIGVGNSTSYDANGNILDLTRGSNTRTYAYYAGTNKVQNFDGSGNDYGYDANANVTRSDPKTIPTITYDSFTQRPTSVSMSSGTSLTLEYGGGTQRVLKNYTSGTNTNSRLYLHGGNDYPLIEKNKTSATTETLAVHIYGLNGAVAKRVGSTVLFLLKDHLGSTRVVMDATGLVRTYYDYDALGNIIRIGTTNEVKYQFTGQEYDESGLHNYRARLYDSDLGKFYAIDPAGQGWSPFVYAGNNPVIIIDQDGRIAWFVPILIGAALNLGSHALSGDVDDFWDAAGFAGVGALGGALSLVGGGGAWYGFQDVLLGAVEGGLTGGLNSLLEGKNFLSGFKTGAIVGGAFGLVSSEQFQNTFRGHGWRSNQQVIKNFYETGAYQEAIDYAVDVYDIDILEGKAKWDPSIPLRDRGVNTYSPGPLGAKWEGVRIGPGAFTGDIYPSQLQGALFHEARHAQHLLKGELARVVQQASTGEVLAYGATLRNAGLLHLSKDVRAYYAMRFSQVARRQFQNRFWYNIPLRNFWF